MYRYKLAEKLSDRLNELNRDLTEMIDEINGVSQTLSKSSKPDDPVSLPLPFPICFIFLKTNLYILSFLKSSASSIHILANSRPLILVPRSYKPRLLLRRRKANVWAALMDGRNLDLILRKTSTGVSEGAEQRDLVV